MNTSATLWFDCTLNFPPNITLYARGCVNRRTMKWPTPSPPSRREAPWLGTCYYVIGSGWAVSIIQQSGITPGVLAGAPFCFTSGQSVGYRWSLGAACDQLAATCTWPVDRHLHVASNCSPQVIWVGKWFSYIYEWPVLKVPTLNWYT